MTTATAKKKPAAKKPVAKTAEAKPQAKAPVKKAAAKPTAKPVAKPAAPKKVVKSLTTEQKKQATKITQEALKAFDASAAPIAQIPTFVPAPVAVPATNGRPSIMDLMNKLKTR